MALRKEVEEHEMGKQINGISSQFSSTHRKHYSTIKMALKSKSKNERGGERNEMGKQINGISSQFSSTHRKHCSTIKMALSKILIFT